MEDKNLVVLILGLALLPLASSSAGAPDCAGNYVVVKPQTASSYGPRDKGRYCDGTVFVPDGGRLESRPCDYSYSLNRSLRRSLNRRFV